MFKRLLEGVQVGTAAADMEASANTIETKFVDCVKQLAHITERCTELVRELASAL
jgi:hypothetical protein